MLENISENLKRQFQNSCSW